MPGLQERERARRGDSAYAGRCGTGNQQLARRPTRAAAGEDVVMHMPGERIDFQGEVVTVGAVGITGCERYYWLTHDDGAVSMMPADVVEAEPRYTLTAKGRELLEQSKK